MAARASGRRQALKQEVVAAPRSAAGAGADEVLKRMEASAGWPTW